MKDYSWLIPVQAAANIADLYICHSVSGRSMMIPVIVIFTALVRGQWDKWLNRKG